MTQTRSTMLSMCILWFSLQSCCCARRYLIAGQGVGCSNYDGFEEIPSSAECVTAVSALQMDCTSSPTVLGTDIYPRGCYYNLAGSSCPYRLYWNENPNGFTVGSSTRFLVCRSIASSPPDSLPMCAYGAGLVGLGGSQAPSLTADMLTCSSAFSFTPYDRDGLIYFQFNPKVSDNQWGIQQWAFNVYASGSSFTTLYDDPQGNAFYDTVNGVAIDNVNNVGYTILSTKYASTGTSYRHSLVRFDLESGAETVLLQDYYPHNCHLLDYTLHRTLMDIDVEAQIVYWMATNYDDELGLFSLQLSTLPHQVQTHFLFDFTVDEQLSQLVVDCNGNIWFTHIFDGLYVYRPGWSAPLLVRSEPNLNGLEIIRHEGSTRMDWIVANYFVLRNYTAQGLTSNTWTSYPAPPRQQRLGSEGDIMHKLQYDYQNDKMCSNTVTNDGNYMLFCYDPLGDTNIVWNFVYGPFRREGLGLRYGNYNQTFVIPSNLSFAICDPTDLDSVRYSWIGGSVVSSGCPSSTSSTCIYIQDTFMSRSFDLRAAENIVLEYTLKTDGFSDTWHVEYDCGNGNGWETANSYSAAGTYTRETATLPASCNARRIRVQFHCNEGTSASLWLADFCVHAEQTGPRASSWPESLPYSDDLSDFTLSGYWSNSGDVSSQTDAYCIGIFTCAQFYASTSGNAELYFTNFSVRGQQEIKLGYNLCFDCDTGAEISDSEGIAVYYSCDGVWPPAWTLIRQYNGTLTSTYGGIQLAEESVALPSECDNVENLNVAFVAHGSSDYHYVDSFTVRLPTPGPTRSPTSLPTNSPTTADPTRTPTGVPSTDMPTNVPTERPTTSAPSSGPTVSPTTSSPTQQPTTAAPTSARPTDNTPSKSPTLNPVAVTSMPSMSPATSEPSGSPTTSVPSMSPTTTQPSRSPVLLAITEEPSQSPIATVVIETTAETTHTTESDQDVSTTETDVNTADGYRWNVMLGILFVCVQLPAFA